MRHKNKIICAIDSKDAAFATDFACDIVPHVGMIKLGLEFFCANGTQGVEQVAKSGADIFLDLKFHDIPNTVAGAVESACRIDAVKMLTVHASGGLQMMEAAKKTVRDDVMLLGVTVLTSLDNSDLQNTGVDKTTEQQVANLASLAQKAGLDGVVCSPQEIEMVKTNIPNLEIVTPGIRLQKSNDDQKRVITPSEAVAKGADYLVIGRPITGSSDPVKAVREILEGLQ